MKRESRKIRIIKTAIELFAVHGYDMVTMQQIANAGNIQIMQLYRDFNNKDELLDAVLDYFTNYLQHYSLTADEIIKKLEAGETPEKILMPFITYYERYADNMHNLMIQMLYPAMYSNEKILTVGADILFEIPSANIGYALKVLAWLGEIPPCDHVCIAELWTLTAAMFAFADLDIGGRDSGELYTECMRLFITMAVRGVKPLDADIVLKWHENLLAQELEIPDADTKQKILRESLRLFSEKGYNGVTNKEIADAVGVQSASSLYRHFKNKSDIMDALIQRQMQAYSRYNSARPVSYGVTYDGPRKQVTLNLHTTYPPIINDYMLHTYRLLFRHRYFNSPQIKAFFHSMTIADCDSITSFLENCAAKGHIPPGPMHSIAVAFLLGVCGLTIVQTTSLPLQKETKSQFMRLLASVTLNGFIKEA